MENPFDKTPGVLACFEPSDDLVFYAFPEIIGNHAINSLVAEHDESVVVYRDIEQDPILLLSGIHANQMEDLLCPFKSVLVKASLQMNPDLTRGVIFSLDDRIDHSLFLFRRQKIFYLQIENLVKIHLRSLFTALSGLEQGHFIEVQKARNHGGRKFLDVDIIVSRHRIVAIPFNIDPVLGAFELTLKLQEILVGLQFGTPSQSQRTP